MPEMDRGKIDALVRLIDDEDEHIYATIRDQLIQMGPEAYSIIQEYSLRSESALQHERLKEVLGQLHLSVIKSGFHNWAANDQHNLFEAAFLVARYRYPELDKNTIEQYLDKIKLDIWLRLNHKFSPLDNVRIINEVIFNKYRFKGDNQTYFAPENSFINQIIERRMGNPISLSILYSIIAQKLYLPILGVNLPQHFILAYKDDSYLQEKEAFNTEGIIPYNLQGETLFYINPFNGGAIFSKFNIDRFVEQAGLSNEEAYYEPCSNFEIIKRIFRNLMNSYSQKGDDLRMAEVKELHEYVVQLEKEFAV